MAFAVIWDMCACDQFILLCGGGLVHVTCNICTVHGVYTSYCKIHTYALDIQCHISSVMCSSYI